MLVGENKVRCKVCYIAVQLVGVPVVESVVGSFQVAVKGREGREGAGQ